MVFNLPQSLLPTWSSSFGSGAAPQSGLGLNLQDAGWKRAWGSEHPASSQPLYLLSWSLLPVPTAPSVHEQSCPPGEMGLFLNPAPFPSACRVPAGGLILLSLRHWCLRAALACVCTKIKIPQGACWGMSGPVQSPFP